MDEKHSYVKTYFELKGFFGLPTMGESLLRRIFNSVAYALNEYEKIPTIIAIILDDDLIKSVKYTGSDVGEVYRREILWLTRNISRAIEAKKDYYPIKAKKAGEPHVVWLAAPTNTNFNNNEARKLFNNTLQKVVYCFDNMSVLGFKQIWDFDDTTSFLKIPNRYTMLGKKKFWEATDRTLRFCHTINFKSQPKRGNKSSVKPDTKKEETHKAKDNYQRKRQNYQGNKIKWRGKLSGNY